MPAFRAVQKSLYYGPYLEVWQNKHDCITYDEELIYVPKIGACRHKNAEFDTTLNFTKNGRLMPKIKNKILNQLLFWEIRMQWDGALTTIKRFHMFYKIRIGTNLALDFDGSTYDGFRLHSVTFRCDF